MERTYSWLDLTHASTHERGEDRRPIRVTWSETVARQETFTLHDLRRELQDIDRDIDDLRGRKEEILTRIKEAREALGIREEREIQG